MLEVQGKSISILFSEDQIQSRVREMGAELAQRYQGKTPLMVGILKGATPFLVDLARAMDLHLEMDFLQVSSYGAGTTSTGEVRLDKDLGAPIEGRHLILVEDTVDTGRTLSYLMDLLRRRRPASLILVSLLDKPSRRVIDVHPDLVGFSIEDPFVVGYGLEVAEALRNLPYVAIYHGESND